MIRIVCLGKIKETYLKEGIEDYLKRVTKYHKIEIIELKDDENILKEETEIIKYIDNHNFNVAMDIDGKKIDSVELSKMIDRKLMEYSNITIFIGSSNGLSDYIKSKMNMKLSFGDITMTHGMFRMVLLEQIYRSFKILNNESYHK